jgi:hypothetical protein
MFDTLRQINAHEPASGHPSRTATEGTGGTVMAETATKLPVKTETKETAPATSRGWQALERLRQEVDQLFDNLP